MSPDLSMLGALPDELLTLVFSFLPAHGVSAVACTCKRWAALAQDDWLWSQMCKKRWKNVSKDPYLSWREYYAEKTGLIRVAEMFQRPTSLAALESDLLTSATARDRLSRAVGLGVAGLTATALERRTVMHVAQTLRELGDTRQPTGEDGRTLLSMLISPDAEIFEDYPDARPKFLAWRRLVRAKVSCRFLIGLGGYIMPAFVALVALRRALRPLLGGPTVVLNAPKWRAVARLGLLVAPFALAHSALGLHNEDCEANEQPSLRVEMKCLPWELAEDTMRALYHEVMYSWFTTYGGATTLYLAYKDDNDDDADKWGLKLAAVAVFLVSGILRNIPPWTKIAHWLFNLGGVSFLLKHDSSIDIVGSYAYCHRAAGPLANLAAVHTSGAVLSYWPVMSSWSTRVLEFGLNAILNDVARSFGWPTALLVRVLYFTAKRLSFWALSLLVFRLKMIGSSTTNME